MTVSNQWELDADTGALRLAAQGWLDFSTAEQGSAETVDAAGRRIGEHWAGEAADSYARHQVRLTGDLRGAGVLAEPVAAGLQAAATALGQAQFRLAFSLNRVRVRCPVEVAGSEVTFRPQDAGDVAIIAREIGTAVTIRAELDGRLMDVRAAIGQVLPDLGKIAEAWQEKGKATAALFNLPPEAAGTGIIRDTANNQFIINSGTGDDDIEVRVDPATGLRIVVINGREHRVPAGMAITVRAGQGSDTITVAPGTQINLTLLGGTGDDTINGADGNERVLAGHGTDTITGGGGNDTISGGSGDDYLDGQGGNDTLAGGFGDDTVYGMSGNDQISGGEGEDYLEGGAGSDTIDGGAGGDTIDGGAGGDTIYAGSGHDVIYGGSGTDTVDGGLGNDTAYTQTTDRSTAEQGVTIELSDVATSITVEGSPEFVARVTADLDMLRSSPVGQQMLANIDSHGETIRIVEGSRNTAGASRISYNPSDIESIGITRPPVAGLYHEMAHIYDTLNGTRVDGRYDNPADPDPASNSERQAVGLPIDADGDGDYEIDPDHPFEYTENGLREEMGRDPRRSYSGG